MNDKRKNILDKGRLLVKVGYEKGNGFMDAVPLLRSKRNKCIVWFCVAGIVIVALFRMLQSGTGKTSGGEMPEVAGIVNFDSAPLGAESPEAVVKQYYKAYKDGDPVAFLNCVNYTVEEKLCMIGPLTEKMSAKDWREQAAIAYYKIKYESEQLRPYDADLGCESATANVYVEASDEWNGSRESAGRLWNMRKFDGKWFIDKYSGGGANWMGLTSLASPCLTDL